MPRAALAQDIESKEGLIEQLRRIDRSGWNSAPGENLLRHVRDRIVRPQVARSGLDDARSSQAEASAWQACWRKLDDRGLRESKNPWGVLWVVARRAVRDEVLEGQHLTASHRARRLLADGNADPTLATRGRPPVSLQALADDGVEPALPSPSDPSLGPGLDAIIEACRRVGWDSREVSGVVAGIAGAVRPAPERSSPAAPWKSVAQLTGVEPARVRRLALLLLGSDDAQSLLAQVVREGPSVLAEPRVQRSLEHTLCPERPSGPRVQVPALAP